MAAPDPRRALVASLTNDLVAETAGLRAVLAVLDPDDWACPTPADGWTVTDQVTHLAYFDEVTQQSLTDPERFTAEAAELTAGGDDYPDRVAARYHDMAPDEILAWLDRTRPALVAAYREADPAVRLPWFGPPMSLASSVSARLMETWAHGQDILDTFGVARPPTLRLRHVANIGIRALPYSFTVNGLAVPSVPIRVDLDGPDGEQWSWGPAEASDFVAGDALDFCLAVTQRRHRDDTGLTVTGETARQWMAIAQSFAGPAGPGRRPGGPWAGARSAGDTAEGA
jgi:uncharacterized protein (TIGR03084 family)